MIGGVLEDDGVMMKIRGRHTIDRMRGIRRLRIVVSEIDGLGSWLGSDVSVPLCEFERARLI